MLKGLKRINNRKKVFIGLSGGVDSSVAAFLLLREGYDVIGVYIRGYNLDGCAVADAIMARRAAGELGIPFYILDMESEYKQSVVNYMIEAYQSGITPNPDVMCNKEIKFGLFYEKALKMGAHYIATGHYAAICGNKKTIYTPKDKDKDQTYFLWALDKRVLKQTMFPLGNLLKSEVRKIASEIGLPNAKQKDSQGICFLGKIKMEDFLSKYIKESPGPIMTTDYKTIGSHKGLSFYTIGQRHLRIEGLGGGEPFYVARKDKDNNALIVAADNHPLLFTQKIILNNVNLFLDKLPKKINVLARVRYRAPLYSGEFIMKNDNKGEIIFSKPCKFVTPGQSAVFYSHNDNIMLGGGIIVSADSLL